MKNTFKTKAFFPLSLFAGFVVACTSVLMPLMTKGVVDSAVAMDVNGVVYFGIKFVIVCLILVLFNQLLSCWQMVYQNELKTWMRMGISNKILKTPLNQLDATRKAEFISIYNNDVSSVVNQYYINTLDIFELTLTIVFSISALLSINVTVAVFIVISNACQLLSTFLFKKPMEKTYNTAITTGRSWTAKISDFLNGIGTIRTYKLGESFKKEIREKNDIKNKADLNYKKMTCYASVFNEIFAHGANWAILFYGGYLILQGEYTAGALLSTMQIADVLSFPVMKISYLINYRNGAKPLKKEIESLMCEDEPENKDKIFDKIPGIKLENIDFNVNEHHILKNVSVEFEAGKKYLIVGESGCGKSTLLKLISGIERDYSGEISYKGKSQRDLGDKIYNFMRIVFQESYIFQKSITDNISDNVENKSLFNSLIDSLKLNKLMEKYRGEIMDEKSAQTLSGGEKQRIAIARALYSKPKILLLDEVTSALDKETSKDVEELLVKYDGTVISVSHAPNKEVLNLYDKIITMDDGKIISITNAADYAPA